MSATSADPQQRKLIALGALGLLVTSVVTVATWQVPQLVEEAADEPLDQAGTTQALVDLGDGLATLADLGDQTMTEVGLTRGTAARTTPSPAQAPGGTEGSFDGDGFEPRGSDGPAFSPHPGGQGGPGAGGGDASDGDPQLMALMALGQTVLDGLAGAGIDPATLGEHTDALTAAVNDTATQLTAALEDADLDGATATLLAQAAQLEDAVAQLGDALAAFGETDDAGTDQDTGEGEGAGDGGTDPAAELSAAVAAVQSALDATITALAAHADALEELGGDGPPGVDLPSPPSGPGSEAEALSTMLAEWQAAVEQQLIDATARAEQAATEAGETLGGTIGALVTAATDAAESAVRILIALAEDGDADGATAEAVATLGARAQEAVAAAHAAGAAIAEQAEAEAAALADAAGLPASIVGTLCSAVGCDAPVVPLPGPDGTDPEPPADPASTVEEFVAAADVNGDGEVDDADVAAVGGGVAGLVISQAIEVLDVNGDGVVDEHDAAAVVATTPLGELSAALTAQAAELVAQLEAVLTTLSTAVAEQVAAAQAAAAAAQAAAEAAGDAAQAEAQAAGDAAQAEAEAARAEAEAAAAAARAEVEAAAMAVVAAAEALVASTDSDGDGTPDPTGVRQLYNTTTDPVVETIDGFSVGLVVNLVTTLVDGTIGNGDGSLGVSDTGCVKPTFLDYPSDVREDAEGTLGSLDAPTASRLTGSTVVQLAQACALRFDEGGAAGEDPAGAAGTALDGSSPEDVVAAVADLVASLTPSCELGPDCADALLAAVSEMEQAAATALESAVVGLVTALDADGDGDLDPGTDAAWAYDRATERALESVLDTLSTIDADGGTDSADIVRSVLDVYPTSSDVLAVAEWIEEGTTALLDALDVDGSGSLGVGDAELLLAALDGEVTGLADAIADVGEDGPAPDAGDDPVPGDTPGEPEVIEDPPPTEPLPAVEDLEELTQLLDTLASLADDGPAVDDPTDALDEVTDPVQDVIDDVTGGSDDEAEPTEGEGSDSTDLDELLHDATSGTGSLPITGDGVDETVDAVDDAVDDVTESVTDGLGGLGG